MTDTFLPTNNMENSFTIVTHVIPAQTVPSGNGHNGPENGAVLDRPPARHPEHDRSTRGPVRTFTRVAKVLGTVQIMTGVVSFLLDIVLTQKIATQLFTMSGHGYWGSALYITAGILSMAAKNKFNSRLIKGSLALNAVSAVTAGIAVILLSLDLTYGLTSGCPTNYYCETLKIQSNGINGVLLVFALLQFIVSICLSLFAVDVTSSTTVCLSSQFPSHGTSCPLHNPFCAYSNEQGVFVISSPNMDNSVLIRPPEYSEIEPQAQPCGT